MLLMKGKSHMRNNAQIHVVHFSPTASLVLGILAAILLILGGLLIATSSVNAQEADPAEAESFNTYVVGEGENLFEIAQNLDVTPEAIQVFTHLVNKMNGTESPFKLDDLEEGWTWQVVGDVEAGDVIYIPAPEHSHDYPAPVVLGDWQMDAEGDSTVVMTNTVTHVGKSFSTYEEPIGYLKVTTETAYIIFGKTYDPGTWYVRVLRFQGGDYRNHSIIATKISYSPSPTPWMVSKPIPGGQEKRVGQNLFKIAETIPGLENALTMDGVTILGSEWMPKLGWYFTPLSILAAVEGLDSHPTILLIYGAAEDAGTWTTITVRVIGAPIDLSSGEPVWASREVGEVQYYPRMARLRESCQVVSFAGLENMHLTGRCNGQLISLNDHDFVVSVQWVENEPAIFITPVIVN